MTVRVLSGDCRAVLGTLAQSSVSAVITSPPYHGLRSYITDPTDPRAALEVGRSRDLADYIEQMVEVFSAVRRVLHPTGSLWLNLGDAYAGSGKGPPSANAITPAHSGVERTPATGGFKGKDLMLVPHRVAMALQGFVTVYGPDLERAVHTLRMARQIGDWEMVEAVAAFFERSALLAGLARDAWYLRSAIVWAKRSGMPEKWIDRPTTAYEMIFLLTKMRTYYYDHFAVREPPLRAGSTGQNRRNVVSGPETDEAWPMADVWWLASGGLRDEEHTASFAAKVPRLAIRAGTSEHGVCRGCGTPWQRILERDSVQVKHTPSKRITDLDRPHDPKLSASSAMRTGKLWVWKHIGWEPVCECDRTDVRPAVVLDPFSGSGTTLLEADRLGRDAIGIELSADYAPMPGRRVTRDAPLFADVEVS